MTETTQPLHDQNVGEIAARLPGATGVFRRFGIDFCCHGDVSLTEAAYQRKLNIIELETALQALDPAAAPQAPRETTALIDHIQTRYHEVHRRQIPELIELSRKVEAVHAAHPNAPEGLADALQQIMGELEVHMKKEELILFPAMRRQAEGQLDAPITEMRHDHDAHGAFLERVAQITDDYTLPDGACRSWQALYAGAAQLKDDLMEHIHLENNVLFPRFEASA
ncbi:MAG TPA: iron-sulfur cluster repair protein YtfE [Aurantimonas coralicida]|uniref:Iron-sulfur cluster repair protein YtfE n=2 Tax=root TaxID=1 RepID=A0A9C9NDP1_9HYPH|nr:iron-sulfur cluster repair protein YtfE [Aurantimonas coralicida]HET99575.1 iron-sulfur cluster repair protein YtfE [Aurantimonas coralicida]